jgi:hypothetical protein
MVDRLMADAIVVIHLLFICFAIAGGLLVLRRRRLIFAHLPCVAWAVLVELMHWRCPLTRWENLFRARYGEAGYDGGFVDHYLLPIIYPDGLTHSIQVAIGLFVFAVNVTIYGILLDRALRRRRIAASGSAQGVARTATL